ncbi:helix-turn-helix domain-containing protein [Endozoicomonas atrinae]|uniref:helix-turn-helix domain-containing protein n=1 Tax=Endozoicomonas atrinae TaxID=1333660 RepID=UPI000827029E|nr:helix-turn-helix domain-containing protein [Endozoicomonas atrinae]
MDWRERTKKEMAKRDINQKILADRLGVTKAAVSLWLNNKRELTETNTIKLQYRIADILEVSPEYLATGAKEDDQKGRTIPHLQTFEEVSGWLLTGVAPADAKWRLCPAVCGERSFYFTMNGSAMDSSINNYPPIPNGSPIFIDPDTPLEVGKLCLFQDNAPVLGVYDEMNNQSFLMFSNSRFPLLEVVKDNFIGRAVGAVHFF